MSETQNAFLRIAWELGHIAELKKLGDALREMPTQELDAKIKDALEKGESKVMITEYGYIDLGDSLTESVKSE